MSETDTSPKTPRPGISSEIIIDEDGRVTISFLTTDLLDLAASLDPENPEFRKFLDSRRIVDDGKTPQAFSFPLPDQRLNPMEEHMSDVRVALIGLDTSHTIEFARRMQAPDVAPEQKVHGLKAVTCLRFDTPFQNKEGLDQRQAQLEAWGVKVTTDFDEAVQGVDAIMLEINDPAYHLEYFTKCADLGMPIFLDKPLADNKANGEAIMEIARKKNVRVWSASSLRFVPALIEACEAIPQPNMAQTFGALGVAPAGSSIVWYGVHAFEMLERALGRGAVSVLAKRDKLGVVAVVEYDDERRGIVEMNEGSYLYGGCLRTKTDAAPYKVNMSRAYTDELVHVAEFFNGAEAPVSMEDALEVTAMLDAAERSVQSGKPEAV